LRIVIFIFIFYFILETIPYPILPGTGRISDGEGMRGGFNKKYLYWKYIIQLAVVNCKGTSQEVKEMFKRRNKDMVEVKKTPSEIQVSDLWDDFDKLFTSFRRDMDRLFWDPVLPSLLEDRISGMGDIMSMDLEDTGDKLILSVDLPGVSRDQTSISLEDDVLTISVGGREEKEEKRDEGRFLLKERRSFRSTRSLTLPEEVDEEKISANLKDGILRVELPKKSPKKKKVKKIKIR